jgi:hypothetical protein
VPAGRAFALPEAGSLLLSAERAFFLIHFPTPPSQTKSGLKIIVRKKPSQRPSHLVIDPKLGELGCRTAHLNSIKLFPPQAAKASQESINLTDT